MTQEHGDLLEAPPTGEQAEAVPTSADPVEAGEERLPSMDELMAQYDAAEPLQELREGEVVLGTVVQIDEQGAMIDVGTKSEGVIPRPELDLIRDEIRVGDQIEVCVLRIEDEDGHLRVSKRQADRERAWGDIVHKQESGEVIEAEVVDAVKGGLLVDLGLYGQGFVPASHVSLGRPRNLQRYVGQRLPLRVIEVERKRKRVVLSHRKVLEEQRSAARDTTVGTLAEGQVRRGVVRRITDFGAFVDLGGLDGLLHVSEMSWTRVESPHEQLRVNEQLEVMILKLNLEEGRISLGRRQLLADPWRDVPKLYSVGQVIRATVLKTREDQALVRVPIGIESVIDIPEELRVRPAVEAVEAVAAEEPAEPAATDAVAEATEVVEVTETVEATETVETTAVAEPTEPVAEAEAPPAPAPAGPAPLVPGAEVEVRIEAVHQAERDLELQLASTPRPARPEAPAGEAGVPLVRGRYSDRRDEEDDEGGRGGRRDRRDRRRERDRDRDRDEARPTVEHLPTAPTSRTLGDLMGDTLRRMLVETAQESEPSGSNPPAAEGSAKESDAEASN